MATEPTDTFPGVLYNGHGVRLAGDGPEAYTQEMSDNLPFKHVIYWKSRPVSKHHIVIEDRLWVLPDRNALPDELPTTLVFHLASLIRSGVKVALVSANEFVCDQVRKILLLATSPTDGNS